MSGLDRAGEAQLRGLLDEIGAQEGDELRMDEEGPAIYRLRPQPMTACVCLSCRYVSLIPSIPRKAQLVWACPQCAKGWALRPPAEVWVEGSRPDLGGLVL